MLIFRKIIFFLVLTAIILIPFFGLRAVGFLPTSVEVILSCGDGLAEGSEICDPGNPPDISPDIGTTTCQDFDDIFGNPFVSGSIGCLADCSNFATSSCYTCGNTNKENEEECDGSDFGGNTCITFGFSGGSLQCTNDCRISIANCESPDQEGGTAGGGGRGGSAGGPTGYNPGSDEENITKVVVKGKSYPNSDVRILIDGTVVGIVRADAKADFYFESSEVTPGIASFGFWSEDSKGLKSTLLTLTFRVISGAVTTITGVYIAPSIDIDKNSVRQGEDVKIYGQTVPDTEVHVHINSEKEFVEQTNSGETGSWELTFNTEPLEVEFHTVKALFQLNVEGNIIKSGFSRTISFHVGKIGGESACPEADLNHDGFVNLTDFSILLFYWGTDNECADQNQNGNVDLVDFSIMMYYWTG